MPLVRYSCLGSCAGIKNEIYKIFQYAALLVFQHGDSDLSEEILEKAARYARRILIDTRKDDYSVFIKAIAIIYFVASSDSADTLEFMCLLLSIADKGKANEPSIVCTV